MAIELKHTFDESTFRHSINGHVFVLHCHHYMSLTTKLAEDYADLGAVRALREATEDSLRPVLEGYCQSHGVVSPEARLEVAREYYSAMGMGRMELSGSETGGTATLEKSHVDEGWIQKWGQHDKPVNHFTCGYLAAAFAAAYGRPARSFQVTETASIVMGAPKSVLAVKAA